MTARLSSGEYVQCQMAGMLVFEEMVYRMPLFKVPLTQVGFALPKSSMRMKMMFGLSASAPWAMALSTASASLVKETVMILSCHMSSCLRNAEQPGHESYLCIMCNLTQRALSRSSEEIRLIRTYSTSVFRQGYKVCARVICLR